MTGPKLVIIRKITSKLLPKPAAKLRSGTVIGPAAYRKAERFVEANKTNLRLAFGRSSETVKKILYSWAGYKLKTQERVRLHTSAGRVDASTRVVECPPWHLLRDPAS